MPSRGSSDGVAEAAPLEAVLCPALPVDLRLTLHPLRRGAGDPTTRVDASGAWWRAVRTPQGPATIRLLQRGPAINVRAWGPGAEEAVQTAPEMLGARDSLEGFDPPPGPVRELHRRMPGLRIIRSRPVLQILVPLILEQKVTGVESQAAYRALVWADGEPPPGPARLRLPPSPERLASMAYFEFHPMGIERRRAEFIIAAAARVRRLEETLQMSRPDARRRLLAFPGVGEWTAAEVGLVALGDPDAVPVGDYHLPNSVAWLLAGEPRADDARMLELLEPYAGHRGRVIRLIRASGVAAPRFGPKMSARSFAKD